MGLTSGLSQITRLVKLLSEKKPSRKEIDVLKKDNEMLKHEVSQLRNSETNMSRGFNELVKRFDALSASFEWHTHHRIEPAGQVMFRKKDYEDAMGVKLDDNLQPIQPLQPEEPVPKDDPPGE